MSVQQTHNEFETKLIQNIEKHGCQVNYVFDPDGIDPDFSYSIGFPKSLGQPEVIIFGLPTKLMHSVINNVRDQCREGLRLSDGGVVEALLEGHVCTLKAVHKSQLVADYFGSAIWYHRDQLGTEMTEAFQIVWPGALNSLFPWDEGCSPDVIEAQPALYEPRGEA